MVFPFLRHRPIDLAVNVVVVIVRLMAMMVVVMLLRLLLILVIRVAPDRFLRLWPCRQIIGILRLQMLERLGRTRDVRVPEDFRGRRFRGSTCLA